MADQHPEEWEFLCARASVERDPQVLVKLVTRINYLLGQKEARLQGKPATEPSVYVFQIAYDEVLLITRAELLAQNGCSVSSALGNEDAKRILANGGDYRVFLLGHAAPRNEREEMAKWLKLNFPRAKVVAVIPDNDPAVTNADLNFTLNGPEAWLAAITSTLAEDGLAKGTAS